MNAKTQWTRDGYEVHSSKDGKDWFRCGGSTKRPSFDKLTDATNHMRSVASEYKHLRLVKLEMNFTLVSETSCAETESEKLAKVLAQAKDLFKNDPAVNVHECSFISMDSLQLSKSQVRIQTHKRLLDCGTEPQRKDYLDPVTKVKDVDKYKADMAAWDAKAKAADKLKGEEIASKLRVNSIPFRTGTEYGWVVFRLA